MTTSSKKTTPQGGGASNTKINQDAAAILGADSSATSPYYTPSHYQVYQLTQSSPQDITAYVNSVMQQLVGRNATAAEIKQYGSELLAAQRANQGLSETTTTYQTTGAGVGKRGTTSGTNLSTGVDPQAFLTTLIQGTGEASAYRAATQYMDAMISANHQFRGAYSG
jgi:hypothetical protein